jgi:hypothetical protein
MGVWLFLQNVITIIAANFLFVESSYFGRGHSSMTGIHAVSCFPMPCPQYPITMPVYLLFEVGESISCGIPPHTSTQR